MKRILIVEDNAKHLADAVTVVEKAGFQAITVQDLRSANDKLDHEVFDGVLTDLFFSFLLGETSEEPNGLIVAATCKRIGVRCVVCTDGYHHGEKYKWSWKMLRAMGGIGMVDYVNWDNYEEEAETKNWQEAIEDLCR